MMNMLLWHLMTQIKLNLTFPPFFFTIPVIRKKGKDIVR